MPFLRTFAALLFCLHAGLAVAAEADWEPFATSNAVVVFFDRGSLTKSDDYVHYRFRVDYAEDRATRDGKYRYRSAVNAMAAQCEAKKVAVTSVELRDGGGARLMQSSRRRDRWASALKDVTPGVEERLMLHACALARGESLRPPQAKADSAPSRGKVNIGSGIVASADGVIVTNHHVVDGCSSIVIIDSEKKRTAAERIASDPKSDLAL
ncbi:MAG TPA: surface-adhesin E family protein, partial [Burkholderiales bacterium]|nr:surface-adhesin E family protein [Burkholderiales bacterium]